ncbi:hypothetical protein LAZ67_4002004, partial [Cordylochernes scorpioides]
MTYLAKVRKCDLSKLAYELGEVVPPESRIVDLKRLILNSQSYEEEFAKQLLETLIEEREQTERAERERMEQTAQTEQAERIERERIEDRKRIERKEQMVMEFELEKLRIQTTRGNNDTSRSTSNDAHYEIRKLMPKYESKDNDLSFYLILFERQAKRLGLDEDQWAFSLLGLLPYEMIQLIARETEEQSGDYRFVKRLLLKRYKLSPEQFRQKFEKHERSQKGSWRDFAFELRGYFNEWIEGMNVENFDALKDLSVTNQLKKKVPNVLRNHLIDDWTKLNNPDELADKLDEYENVRTEMGPPHWNAKHLIPPSFQQKSARFPNQSEVKETKQGTNVSGQDAARNEISETYPNTLRRMVNRAIRNDKGEPKCFNCNQFGHIARDCPAPRTTLTCRGCGQTGHKERNCTRPKEGLKVANLEVEGLETVPPDVYLKDVKIDNKETVKAMIDTGSSSCLMRESVARRINVDIEPDSTSLYGIGNQTAPAARTVGKTTVDLEIDGVVGKEIAVFIVNDDAQPYDLLIGRTWTDLPYVSFARIGKELHIGYSSEFPFANLQEEIKSRRIELRATETVQLESDSINFTSAITDEVKDGYVLFTGVDDACVDSLLEVVDGKTTVPIISAGKGKLRVRKNQCVGRVELLNLDDIVVNLDVAEDSFQTKNEEKREGQDQTKRKRPILPEDINVNHSLTSKERQEILDVVNEYRDCFALGMEELGCTDVTKMDIKEVDGSKPVCLRPYKTTASEREAIREIVREWKDNGIVTETRSPYASPVLLVRKKTGDHRLVVDYRRLNIQTVKDKFPLPRIDDLLEGLRNAKFFTTLDLAHGYLQIPLTDKAKLKTAFITPDDTGQFERMIFGLANAPAEFQRLMHTVLGPLLNKKAFCYLDDVIIPAKDWREMIERLREVLERIRSAKLTLKPSKCEFGKREVELLGHVISTGGLKPGPRKIKAIEEFPEPKNVHDIRRFLGLTNFFRRFVKDFARKAEPLSRLTKKGSQFEWKEEQRRSFGGLRKDLVEYPVLAHYNPELKTEVHCDASAEGLAGMVLQMDEDGKWRLVYCVSKKTTEAEKMYHSSKLELMAIVWTLDRLRQFLVGIKFTVVTDCQALVYMNAKKTTNPQIARWYNLIQEYDFEIRHKPGEKMAHVDGMSRAPVDDPRDTMEEIVEKNLEVRLTITLEEQILMIQHSDPELRDLIQIFRKDPCDRTVGEQNRINDYSYRRKSGRGARSRRYPPTQPTTFLQRKTPGNETVTRRSRRLQGLQPELSTVLAFPARKKMEREENRPFCHRWRDPTVFSGERGEDSQRWLSDFQRVARYNKWDDFMCLANVIFYLTGTAKCWFENFEEILNSWEEFKIKFCEIFGNKEDTARKAENILRTRAQTSGENVESYIQEVLLLCKQSNPRMSEGEKVSHLIKGVAEEVYQALIGKDIGTVDQFVAFCRRFEAFKRMRVAPPRFSRLPNVTTISTAEPENLEALIRRIVREEVQKFMAPPSTFAAQDIDTPPPDLRDVIRSEIQQTLAPISAPRQPESFRPRRQYLPQNDQVYRRRTEGPPNNQRTQWRTEDDRPICFHCGRPGHAARYCRDRRQAFADARLGRETVDFGRPRTENYTMGESGSELSQGRFRNPSPYPPPPPPRGRFQAPRRTSQSPARRPSRSPSRRTATMEKNWINVNIQGRNVQALVDSGADYSVVSEAFRRSIKATVFKENGPLLRAADKKPIVTLGKCSLEVQIKGLDIIFDFVVAAECSHDVILGWDFFKATDAIIDCGENKLYLSEAEKSYEWKDLKLCAAMDCVIPPKSFGKIVVTNQDVFGSRDVVVTGSKRLQLEKGLFIPSSIVRFLHGRAVLWVTNSTHQSQVIPSDMKIGTMQDLEVGSISNLDACSEIAGKDEVTSPDVRECLISMISTDLEETEKNRLLTCLNEFSDIFDFEKKSFPVSGEIKHKIDTSDYPPVRQRPYRVSPAERRVIQSEVEKMMETKIIRPLSSPWASPVILVRKKDGSLRFCVDYRRLNKITKKDVYPLPRIDDALDTLSGSRYFSTMDMRSGYWQIEVDDKDREKTAFITPDGLYEFNQAGLCLNYKKCHFASRQITILGHVVNEFGTQPDPEKVKAIVHFPKPRNISETRSFLGLSSYYRRFIKSYANKSRPLNSLLKKDEKFIWGEEQDESFRILKQELGSSPVLGHFIEGAETHVHTDASGYGLGAVLVQIQNDAERPIAYASRTLTKAEKNYSTTEKECLAVVWALGKFRPYLYGRPFTVVTDHHSLCWLVGLKDPSGRLARWALKLQEYDINIVYKSGRKHKDADCLSRSPLADTAEIEGHITSIQDIAEEQSKDPHLVGIREKLANENLKGYQMIGGVLYKKNYDPEGKPWLLVFLKQMRHEILKDVHDTPMAGHLGFAKTYDRVRKRFYWPGLYRTVSQYIAHCKECQRRKGVPQKPPGLLVPIPPTTSPFQKIGIDYLGRFPISHTGNRWIIVATDYLTRFTITKAAATAEATELSTFLIEDVILKHGAPREIITDRGRNFMSQTIREINNLNGTIHRFTTAYHPQTNGLTERLNKTLTDMISIFYTAPYQPAGTAEDYVGHLVTNAEDARMLARLNILQAQSKDKERYDKKHQEVTYKEGDLVWVFTPVRTVGLSEKLLKRYFGPYRVIRKISSVNYQVEGVTNTRRRRKTQDIVHVVRMKPYHDPEVQEQIAQ